MMFIGYWTNFTCFPFNLFCCCHPLGSACVDTIHSVAFFFARLVVHWLIELLCWPSVALVPLHYRCSSSLLEGFIQFWWATLGAVNWFFPCILRKSRSAPIYFGLRFSRCGKFPAFFTHATHILTLSAIVRNIMQFSLQYKAYAPIKLDTW